MDKDSHLIFENYKDLSSFDITKHVKDVMSSSSPDDADIVWLKNLPQKLNIDVGEKVEYGIPLGNPKTLRQGVVVNVSERDTFITVKILDIYMLPRYEGQGRQ